MKILLAGYFGCGNLGDEAILEALIAGIKKYIPDPQITVLSGNPEETAECYDVVAFDRTNLRSFRRNLKNCDVFILGGGGILQDITSSKSLYYYLYLVRTAKRYKKKVVLLGHSLGPIKRKFNRFLVKRTLKDIDLLTIRDEISAKEVKKLSLKPKEAFLASDISFLLSLPERSETDKLFELEGIKHCRRHLIGVALREKPGYASKHWINKIAEALDKISEKNCQIVFLTFHYPDDLEITGKVMKKMKSPAHLIMRRCRPTDMLGIISRMDVLIGMRLHSVIFSTLAATPMIGLSYDPKVSSFLSSIKFPFLEINDLRGEELIKTFDHTLDNLNLNRNTLKNEALRLKKIAALNFDLLKDAIEKEKVRILGIDIDNTSMEDSAGKIMDFIKSGTPHLITSANPEILLEAQKDMELTSILNTAALNLPDGVGITLASRLKGLPLKKRVTGIDLMLQMIELANSNDLKIFLLGGKEGTAEAAAQNLKDEYPGLNIAGTHHGYFKNDALTIENIKNAAPDILFVGLGSPRQEKWSYKYLKELNIPAVMVVGGSFDVLSKRLKRAPVWMRRSGIEWLFRLIKEPKRLPRILKLPVFLYKAVKGGR
ncbi:polysaccharide pyruvyl transferase CsaB [Candidatus Margulisiibacteriota bacterium]